VPAYEDAVERFIDALLRPGQPNPFIDELDRVTARIAPFGFHNSLAQVALKFTVPGVPDLYQGSEQWNFSLVDPDNRRPVDWAEREKALAALRAGTRPDARTAKLYVTWKTLRFRAEHEEDFAGSYEPVELGAGVCAFVRGGAVLVAAAVDPFVTPRAPDGWRDVLGVDGLLLCVPS
jgi:(1->4)-alpha-D-glucan 1-alpha-D-glucosylmutase